MKTPSLLVAALLLTLSPHLSAADGSSYQFIKTNSGKVYANCRVFKTDPDGVILVHQHGAAKLLFADLTSESRAMLGYDPEKEAAYEKERAEQKRKDREALWQYRCELAKAQTAAYTAEARRMELITVQNIAGGYGGGYGGYGYGLDGFLGFGYGGYGPGYGYGNGYGYGANCGYGFGYGNNCGYGFGLGSRFGCSPLRGGFVTRGGTNFLPQNDCRRPNTLVGVIGRSCFAPAVRCVTPLGGTPAMGRNTPAMGRSTPALGGGGGKH